MLCRGLGSFGHPTLVQQSVIPSQKVPAVGLTMDEVISDGHAAECLLNVASFECLPPQLGASICGVLILFVSRVATAAGQMADHLLHAGAQRLTCVTSSTGWVAHRDILPRHDENQHVQHPTG